LETKTSKIHVQWFILWIFLDITFKIIPKIWRSYKLFTISTIDNKENKTILIGFVLFKFMNNESYRLILKILNENFDFNPKIIHNYY